jgi:hypothetical protein
MVQDEAENANEGQRENGRMQHDGSADTEEKQQASGGHSSEQRAAKTVIDTPQHVTESRRRSDQLAHFFEKVI